VAKNVTEGFFVRFFVEIGLTRMILNGSCESQLRLQLWQK